MVERLDWLVVEHVAWLTDAIHISLITRITTTQTTTSAVAESPSVRGTGPAASISTSSSVEGQTGAAAEGSSTATGATVE